MNDRPLTIGLLSFEYPPETGFGGIGTYTWHQARALALLGHTVHVIAGASDPGPLESVKRDGVMVHRYRADGRLMKAFGQAGRFRCYWTRQRLENAWCMYRAVEALSRRVRFDVLEMPECGAEGALVTKLVKTPSVVRFHSPSRLIMPFYDTPRADRVMCSAVEQGAIRSATALTSCSRFLAQEVKTAMGVSRPIAVIPNGIDLEWFDNAARLETAARHGIPAGRPVVFFAGRMERRKGIHLCRAIVEGVARRCPVSFVFAGGDLFRYMQDELLPAVQQASPDSSVHYLGKLDLAELRSWVRAADVFMLPSLWENCPYSCLEAMAAGRAIVSSDQGGMPELIEHGVNGLLASNGDARSFAVQITALIGDAALRRRLGDAARRTIEARYAHGHTARLSVEVYRTAMRADARPELLRLAAGRGRQAIVGEAEAATSIHPHTS